MGASSALPSDLTYTTVGPLGRVGQRLLLRGVLLAPNQIIVRLNLGPRIKNRTLRTTKAREHDKSYSLVSFEPARQSELGCCLYGGEVSEFFFWDKSKKLSGYVVISNAS